MSSAPQQSQQGYIPAKMRITGTVQAPDDIPLLVDGEINGDLTAEGQKVTIGKTGMIRGNIHAPEAEVRIQGQMTGNITAKSLIIEGQSLGEEGKPCIISVPPGGLIITQLAGDSWFTVQPVSKVVAAAPLTKPVLPTPAAPAHPLAAEEAAARKGNKDERE